MFQPLCTESEIEDLSVSSKTSGPSLKETLSGFITTPFSSVLVLHVKDHHYAYVFTQHTQYVEPEVTSNATVKRGRGRAKPRSVSRSRGTSGGSGQLFLTTRKSDNIFFFFIYKLLFPFFLCSSQGQQQENLPFTLRLTEGITRTVNFVNIFWCDSSVTFHYCCAAARIKTPR